MVILKIENLHKSFNATKAVQGVSFQVTEGEIYSLLGPNGAGKTTTLSILCTLLKPDSGTASVMGFSTVENPMQVKKLIGVVPQEIALYDDLSAQENLFFWGKMYGLKGAVLAKRVTEILEMIGLEDRSKERVGKYSGGMKRRVNVGIALLHHPKVIFMDEPTVGIDPQTRRSILDSVKDLKNQGMTVLYTTHYMEEAQEISDHIGIMDHGKMIAEGTHQELVKIVGGVDRIHLGVDSEPDAVVARWKTLPGVREVLHDDIQKSDPSQADATHNTKAPASITILAEDSNQVLPLLFETGAALGVKINSVEVHEPNLETVFLHLTGRALRD